MDKNAVRLTMLSLEKEALQHARDDYLEYVASARIDRSETVSSDEQAQAVSASQQLSRS